MDKFIVSDIESGLELPDKTSKPRHYPALYTMEVGQSFARPLAEYKKLHSASQACRKKTMRYFALRSMGDVVRIWRVT
jgi:hypothetical protein